MHSLQRSLADIYQSDENYRDRILIENSTKRLDPLV